MNFREYLNEMNSETFDIGKDLDGQELKDALAVSVKKCTHDHRSVNYDKATGKVTYI